MSGADGVRAVDAQLGQDPAEHRGELEAVRGTEGDAIPGASGSRSTTKSRSGVSVYRHVRV